MELEATEASQGTCGTKSSLGLASRRNGESSQPYMTDQQEWLALDFKEELRWKQLLAYEFAHQIVEWHLASPEEKADMMVNERGWGPPSALGPERTVEEDIEMLVGDAQDLPDVVMDVGAGLDPSGSDVLEDMAEAEVEVKREEDATMADADGEADADADADAEGEDEDLDADGEAEEVEEIGEGVIGLEGWFATQTGSVLMNRR